MRAYGGQRPGARSWSVPPPRLSRSRALLAGLLTLLLPGLGHLCTGRVRRGLRWLSLSLAAACVLAVVAIGLGGAPASVLEPRVLLWLLLANAAAGLFRAAAVADAARRLAHRGTSPLRTGGGAVLLAALVAVTLAPHAIAGVYGWHTHRVLTTVFVDPAPAPVTAHAPDPPVLAPAPTEVPTTVAVPTAAASTREPTARASLPVPGDPSGRGTAGTTLPPLQASAGWAEGGRLTVALLGSDAGPGRSGARTDAMLVATLDLDSGEMALIGVPRNLTDYPVAEPAGRVRDRYCPTTGGWQQLSALYNCLSRYRDAAAAAYPDAPDPAARGVADTLGVLTGLTVDHYVLVDLSGFVRVVDALGGVSVHVARPVRTRLSSTEEPGEWVTVDIPAGEQVLNGQRALGFVRSRTGTDDYDRMRRQRCLVSSLAATADTGTLLRAFPALAGVAVDHVTTDVPVDRLPHVLRLRGLVDLDALVTVGLVPPRFQDGEKRPDLEQIRAVVQQALHDPASLRSERATAHGLDEACG